VVDVHERKDLVFSLVRRGVTYYDASI